MERCKEYLEDAEQLLKQRNVLMAASYYGDAAKCFEKAGAFEAAAKGYLKAAELQLKEKDYSLAAKSLEDTARCFKHRKGLPNAHKYYGEAAINYLRAATQHLQERRHGDAASNFEDAATCYENLRDQESMRKCLQKAMETYLEMGGSPRVHTRMGFLLTRMDRFEEALKHYGKVIGKISHRRILAHHPTVNKPWLLPEGFEDQSFMEHVSHAFTGACYCIVRLAEQQVGTWESSDAVMLSEEYRARRLAVSLQEEGVDEWNTHWRRWRMEYDVVSEFFQDLQIKLNILYYLVEPRANQVVILAWKPSSPSVDPTSHVRLNVPMGSLEELKAKYQAALRLRDRKRLEEVMNELDDLILPDLKHLDARAKFLLLIPDPLLQWVPWELLGYSKGACLGLKFGLVKAYSLDLARIAMNRGSEWLKLKKLAEWKELSAVLFGNPTLDLPFTEEEVTKTAELLEKRNVTIHLFQRDQAKFSAYSQACRYGLVDIVHFAGHGTFDAENPLASDLKFSDRWIQPPDVERENFRSAPIVVLSACQSGLATPIGGEVLGFIKGFISAGGTSILATNWMIYDDSSRDLVLTFYEGVLSQKSVATALRDARRQIHQKYGGDPFVWAAYTLYGDPSRTLTPGREITEDDVYALLGYVGNPDETLSHYALRALNDVIENKPQILTSALTDGLTYYEDWEYPRVMKTLNATIMEGSFRNLDPIEESMREVLWNVEEDYPSSKSYIRELAFEALQLIAESYDGNDDVESLERVLRVLILALVDRNDEIRKSAEEELRTFATAGRADLVAKHLTEALEDEENFIFPEDIEVVLKLLDRAILDLEELDPVIDALAKKLEDLRESETGRQIMAELDEELRERLVSRLEISKLRRIASDHGVESAYKKDEEELVSSLLEKLQDLSLEELEEELNSY